MSSSPEWVESIRTQASGNSAVSAAVASAPLMPGRRRSMMTTVGRCLRKAASAASPVPASATTSISGSTFREAESPIRTMKWSSTTRIRIGFEVFIRDWRFVERNVYCDGRPVSWLALDLESGSHRLGPLAHIQQTKVSDAGYFAGREALAIVTDAETDASRAIIELYSNMPSLAVLYGIGNSFLANAKQVHLDRTRQTCGFATDLYLGFDLTVGRERLHNFSQSRNQAAILQQMTA